MKKEKRNAIVRRIKIYSFLSPRYTDPIYAAPNYIELPYIRLRGKWLEDIGFHKDNHIRIITSDKCIVILPEEEFVDLEKGEAS